MAAHLRTVGASLDSFAIPWFTTCMSHAAATADCVFPLWDRLLAEAPASRVAVHVAAAALCYMRQELLAADDLAGCLSALAQTRTPPLPAVASPEAADRVGLAACLSLRHTPASLLEGNNLGLHLLETTTAEVVGTISHHDYKALASAGRIACVLQTGPVAGFDPGPGAGPGPLPPHVLVPEEVLSGPGAADPAAALTTCLAPLSLPLPPHRLLDQLPTGHGGQKEREGEGRREPGALPAATVAGDRPDPDPDPDPDRAAPDRADPGRLILVMGPVESVNRRLAQLLMEELLLPGVCLVAWPGDSDSPGPNEAAGVPARLASNCGRPDEHVSLTGSRTGSSGNSEARGLSGLRSQWIEPKRPLAGLLARLGNSDSDAHDPAGDSDSWIDRQTRALRTGTGSQGTEDPAPVIQPTNVRRGPGPGPSLQAPAPVIGQRTITRESGPGPSQAPAPVNQLTNVTSLLPHGTIHGTIDRPCRVGRDWSEVGPGPGPSLLHAGTRDGLEAGPGRAATVWSDATLQTYMANLARQTSPEEVTHRGVGGSLGGVGGGHEVLDLVDS